LLSEVHQQVNVLQQSVRKERNRQHHKDPEIDKEVQQHGTNAVNILYDSSR